MPQVRGAAGGTENKSEGRRKKAEGRNQLDRKSSNAGEHYQVLSPGESAARGGAPCSKGGSFAAQLPCHLGLPLRVLYLCEFIQRALQPLGVVLLHLGQGLDGSL